MGFWNPRAICPQCGAKIHTQPRKFKAAEGSSFLEALKQQTSEALKYRGQVTGTECPQCHVALTGNVRNDNKAEAA